MSTIKVLANKVLGFHNGDIDKRGNLVVHKTKIGFCELPDWVEKTPYYKAAILDGSLKPFQNSATTEEVLKESEKLQAIKDEIKALEEKRDLLNTTAEIIAAATAKDDTAEADAKSKK